MAAMACHNYVARYVALAWLDTHYLLLKNSARHVGRQPSQDFLLEPYLREPNFKESGTGCSIAL
jgi:hypothetical protein